MNVSLTPELESLVNKKVKTGLYNSASEVVREALRLLEEQDLIREIRRKELRKEILKGIEDLRAGNFITLETDEDYDTFAKQVMERGRQKLAERRKRK